jgi:hypothetical protein
VVVVGLLTITDRWTFGARSCTASYLKLPIQDRLSFMTFHRKEHIVVPEANITE